MLSQHIPAVPDAGSSVFSEVRAQATPDGGVK